jgi:hypothetical protein
VVRRFDGLVDVQDLAVFSDVVRPATRHASFVETTKRFGNCFFGIAQNRIVDIETFGKVGILFDTVDAGGEVSHVKFTDGVAALTERLAFLRSATGKRLGIPGDHNRLFPLELFAGVGFAVATHHLELGSVVADGNFRVGRSRHQQGSCAKGSD